MIAGRAARIVLASFAIVGAAVLTLVGFVKPAIESVYGCDDCSLGTPPIVLIAVPSVYAILAVGVLLRPAVLVRPLAVACTVAAIIVIGPVAQMPDPTLATVVLCLLGASIFLLAPPLGDRAGMALAAWMISIMAALGLWVLDGWGSNFMVTEPVGAQPAFLVVAMVLVGAGLLAAGLQSLEASGDRLAA